MTKEAQLTAIDDEIKQLIEELETLDAREEEVQCAYQNDQAHMYINAQML